MNEEKKQQVLALGRLGWSLRKIEEATGVRRETAGGYLRAQGIKVRRPGNWGRSPTPGAETAKPAIAVPTDSEPTEERGHETASVCEPYRELIMAALGQRRNAMAIWQELVDTYGFAGRYDSVKRFVRKLRGEPTTEARVVIETAPGEEAQVDYGTGPMVRDPATGKYRRTRLFVMTLGHSRKSVRFILFKSSAQIWAELHEKAFRRLGGATRVVVPDYVPGNIIGLLFPAAFCALGRPRAVECGAQA